MSVAEAARRGKASEQSISTWKRQFLEGGKAGLGEGGKPGVNPRERAMLDEIEELKAAHRERLVRSDRVEELPVGLAFENKPILVFNRENRRTCHGPLPSRAARH